MAPDATDALAVREKVQEFLTTTCLGNIELIKKLAKQLDNEGETPVLHAARQGHTATVQYLIEQGADPAIPNAMGAAALHHAAGNGHIEVVKLLLSKSIDVDLQSDAGTPLLWDAGLGQEDVVKVLLEHHANVHAQTKDDNVCPLVSAAAANSLSCVKLLVKTLDAHEHKLDRACIWD